MRWLEQCACGYFSLQANLKLGGSPANSFTWIQFIHQIVWGPNPRSAWPNLRIGRPNSLTLGLEIEFWFWTHDYFQWQHDCITTDRLCLRDHMLVGPNQSNVTRTVTSGCSLCNTFTTPVYYWLANSNWRQKFPQNVSSVLEQQVTCQTLLVINSALHIFLKAQIGFSAPKDGFSLEQYLDIRSFSNLWSWAMGSTLSGYYSQINSE